MKGTGPGSVLARFIIFFSLAILPGFLHAQAPPPEAVDWHLTFVGHVTEFDEVKGKDVALVGAVVNVYAGSTLVASPTISSNGKFKVDTPPNSDYILTITKSGYITKKIEINTYNVPQVRTEGAFGEYDVEIELFKMYPGLDYSCLDQPIARIVYNPAPDVDDFDYDKVYLAKVQACIDNLKRLADEAKKRQKLYDDAIARADKAFSAKDWEGAKATYNEALGIIATEQYPKDQIAKCDDELNKQGADKKKYDDAIAAADALFKSGDFTGAKTKYQEASGMKPAEQYPKDQIAKCDVELGKLADKKKYDDLISQADAKFAATDFTGAKGIYQQASVMRSTEQYPKDQIAKCDAEINKSVIDKKYNDAIAAADALFKSSDWTGAKTKYTEASGIKPAEQYPKDQIALCDANIAKAGADKKYNDLIAQADAKFKASDWAGAKTIYQQASDLKNTEQYPKDQMKLCDAALAKVDLDKKYNDAIAAADALFKTSDWAGAKAKYLEASGLKTAEQYPKDQIKLCDANLAKEGLDKKYNDLIAQADTKFKASDWAGAKTIYQQASAVKSDVQYPKDQIAICDKNIQAAKDKPYNDLIAQADDKFKANDWAGAKTLYTQASAMKATEQYPKDQIKICDANLAKAGVDKKYNDLIAQADEKFKASDWAGAKTIYQQASAVKSDVQYPKDQIAKCDANALADIDKKYKDALAAADGLFKTSDWENAKVKYQEASGIKPAEQYPKDQIKLCDKNIGQAGLDKKYNDLIAQADTKFKASDWAGAKTIYQQASAVKGDVQYPKDQIAICDKNIQAAKDKPYNDLIAQADDKFKSSDWAGAKTLYTQASAMKATEQYPKDQIKICDANLAKAGVDKKYNDLIAQADEKFKASDWAGAKTIYQQASAVKSDVQYPKDQIAKCDANALADIDKKYKDALAAADGLFKTSDWENAKAKYQEASGIKPSEQYPKDQIKLCDKNIGQAGLDKKYNDLIAQADTKFKTSDWAGAKTIYQQASAVKGDVQYPKDQIAICDNNLAKEGVDKKYADLIKQADAKFGTSDWAGAKIIYQQAQAVKGSEKYPADQIAICDKNISQLGVDKQYSAAIAAADVLFTAKNWSGAKEKYQEASGIKPGEQYPKDRMKACDDELAKLSSLDQQYTAAVKRGDSAMAINDLETAQTAFTNAKNLKPAEKYPPQKLAEIAGLLSENSKDKAYRALIAKADSLLKLDSLIDAKKVYQSALVQKPSDEYPKKKIAEIDARLSDIKFQQAKDAKYNKLITQADTKFKSKDYKGAKSLYQQALQEKPLEIYPKTQINACDDALNPKVVKVPDSTKVVIGSDEYVSDLVKNYPPGVTETQMKEEGAEITKRVVIVGNKGWVYTKKVYSWGTFYFKDEQQITQAAYDYDTNATWVNKQNTDYQKNHK